MQINLSGTPGVYTDVKPVGSILANEIKGIICVHGPTKRGEPGENYLFNTWGEFLQTCGGLLNDDNFPLLCKQALEADASLRVSRAFHYTNTDDISTAEGAKATDNLTNLPVIGVGASIQFTLAVWTGDGDNITVNVPDNTTQGLFELLNYDGTGVETPTAAVTAILSQINGGTGTHGYTATNPSGELVVISRPVTLGAAGNGYMATMTLGGAAEVTGAGLKFQGGITAYGALAGDCTAKAVGSGYDATTVVIADSTSGIGGQVDITITLPDSVESQVITGVNRELGDAGTLAGLNNQMQGVEFSGLTGFVLPIGTFTLSGGTQDISLIDDFDFKGSSVGKTGYHSFDNVVDSMRIFNIARATHDANLFLAQYCSKRKDMRSRGYCPLGLNIQGIDDFREGTGIYSHVPVDDWYMDYFFAEVYVSDPDNLENKLYAVQGGGFQASNRTDADKSAGEWYSDSGNDYGKIKGVNGLRLNLGSPGNTETYGTIYENGVNAIIDHESLGIVSWGNRTTLRDRTSLLSKSNIADLVVYIGRELKKLAAPYNFKPNDTEMFNELYRRVAPWIRDVLVAGRAIEGDDTPKRGEGTWWYWFGDQLAPNLGSLQRNTLTDVDAGKYRISFMFKPIGANEYIGIDLNPADSLTVLNVSQLTETELATLLR